MSHRASQHAVRTPVDLINAATLGARIATRASAARGEDEETIRLEVIGRFRKDLEAESYGPFADERLMAAAQSAVSSVLEELRSGRSSPNSDKQVVRQPQDGEFADSSPIESRHP
jgi:hypothetical protein